jgi:hypothetical protein
MATDGTLWPIQHTLEEFWYYEDELKEQKKRLRRQLRELAEYYHLPRFTDPLARDIPAFQPLLAEWALVNQRLDAFDAEFARRVDAMSMTELLEQWNAAAGLDDGNLAHLFSTNIHVRIKAAHAHVRTLANSPLENLDVVDFPTIIGMYDDFLNFFERPNLHIRCGFFDHIEVNAERRRWQRLYRRYVEYTESRTRAVMESTHARLGQTSMFHTLDPDLARHIVTSSHRPYEPAPCRRWSAAMW